MIGYDVPPHALDTRARLHLFVLVNGGVMRGITKIIQII